MRKEKGKINPALWDETKDSYTLAAKMGVTPAAIRQYAHRTGMRYQFRPWGSGLRGGTRAKMDVLGNIEERTDRLAIIRGLVKQWRAGNDEAGKELQNYGIRATRIS